MNEVMERKPCPFCGGEAKLKEISDRWAVYCKIGCAGTQIFNKKERPVAAWNRRAQQYNEPPTNADHIRGMSDEELAVFMRDMMDCVSCRQVMSLHDITCTGNYNECVSKCKEWLLKPEEEELHSVSEFSTAPAQHRPHEHRQRRERYGQNGGGGCANCF